MKEHSITLSDYVSFKKPNYVFLRVTPNVSIRNYSSDVFIRLVTKLYINIGERIRYIDKKLFFECASKLGYYIYIEKDNVEFFFVVPERQYGIFKDKIIDVWSNKLTIDTVDSIPNFSSDCTKYYLTYKKNDALSLNCDKRNNYLLSSQLNVLHIMEDGDKAGVFYNFIPTQQRSWRVDWDNAINGLKVGKPNLHSKLSCSYILRVTLNLLTIAADTLLEAVSFSKDIKKVDIKRELDISSSSRAKRDEDIVTTQIICVSESSDKSREINNALSLCNSFEIIAEDNTLVYSKIRKPINLLDTKIKHADTFKAQSKECQNFIGLPGREILSEHKQIAHTNVLETQVPIKLQTGYIHIGDNTCRGNTTHAYLRDNWDQGNFPLVLVGEQGSGKTTMILNYIRCILKRDEGAMVIDYIKNCELSSNIEKEVPKDKLIILDMSDIKQCQGIGYNELKPKSKMSEDMLDVATRKAQYIEDLINSLNIDGEPLSTSMERYLNASATIVSLDNKSSLKDVVRCLNDFEYRDKMIKTIPKEMMEYLSDEIISLRELDEQDKEGNSIGTRHAKVDGVNHRINLLKKDMRLKMMFNKSTEQNIDLVKAMDEGKVILVKMPQEYFVTPYSKNVVVTYLFTKVWAAMLVRGCRHDRPRRFHLLDDEIFQAKTAMKLLAEQEVLPQTRKFGAKFVFSCQYIGQISTIDQTLRSAGASYMLLKGSGKANFNEFKDELAPYTLEDLELLPQYHSLNLINYEDGRAKFITKLPPP